MSRSVNGRRVDWWTGWSVNQPVDEQIDGTGDIGAISGTDAIDTIGATDGRTPSH